jgi:hypothetical protein
MTCPACWCARLMRVPEISRFFGIVVAMYYDDHPPPHFHVRYGEHRAILEIDTAAVLFGDLPYRVLGMVVEWASSHRLELEENWGRARARAPLTPIRPLE